VFSNIPHGVNDVKQTKHTDRQQVPDRNVLDVHKNLEEINHQVMIEFRQII